MNDNKKFNTSKTILKITLTAVFSALCFVSLFLRISIPSAVGKPYIHLGNIIIVVAALLFGGPVGALSGAIGMGLFDIVYGYGIWTIKTIILKAIIGLVCGFIYTKYKKKNTNITIRSMIFGSFFFLLALISLILAIINNGTIEIGSKTIDISWPIYTFSFIIAFFIVLISFITKNKAYDYKIAIYATTVAFVCNIFGEFVGKLIKCLLEGQGITVSLISSLVSIPTTIINATISIVAVMIIYPALKKAIGSISFLKEEKDQNNINE